MPRIVILWGMFYTLGQPLCMQFQQKFYFIASVKVCDSISIAFLRDLGNTSCSEIGGCNIDIKFV